MPELLYSLYASDTRGQVGAEKPGIGSLVSKTANSCQLLVDRIRCQPARFQIHAVAHDHDTVESQSGFGAIPGDELIDGKLVDSTRTGRSEAIKHRHFGMVEIGQPK